MLSNCSAKEFLKVFGLPVDRRTEQYETSLRCNPRDVMIILEGVEIGGIEELYLMVIPWNKGPTCFYLGLVHQQT